MTFLDMVIREFVFYRENWAMSTIDDIERLISRVQRSVIGWDATTKRYTASCGEGFQSCS